jgi:tRNA A37 N6-isopentenylltransferase MiaA
MVVFKIHTRVNTKYMKTRRQEFIEEIDQALKAGPYANDPNQRLHDLYCIGLLRELLAYSAMDLMEVRHRIKQLASREPKSADKPGAQRRP